MSGWINEIVRIQRIDPHPNADKLEIATVLNDFPVVVTKGSFSVGDLAAYIGTDSIVPDNEMFAFLIPPKQIQRKDENGKTYHEVIGKKFEVGSVPEHFRIIKAKKIRGVYSQGLLVKNQNHLTSGLAYVCDSCYLHVGDSIVELFDLKKWEEPEDDESKFTAGNGNSEKSPYRFPYYDIESARKYAECLVPGEQIVLEEKLHGCNAAYMHDGNRLWRKSRNLFKAADGNLWHQISINYHLEEKLAKYPHLVFFGEIYGRVKGFPYDTNGMGYEQIRFFDIYDLSNQKYLDWIDRNYILDESELPRVPGLLITNWNSSEWENLKQTYGEGNSTLNSTHVREGFVIRPVKERFEPKLNSRMIVKYVGKAYSLVK